MVSKECFNTKEEMIEELTRQFGPVITKQLEEAFLSKDRTSAKSLPSPITDKKRLREMGVKIK